VHHSLPFSPCVAEIYSVQGIHQKLHASIMNTNNSSHHTIISQPPQPLITVHFSSAPQRSPHYDVSCPLTSLNPPPSRSSPHASGVAVHPHYFIETHTKRSVYWASLTPVTDAAVLPLRYLTVITVTRSCFPLQLRPLRNCVRAPSSRHWSS
jgi:hypothetical protein